MENASKALIIAGATLIAVLILTSMIYLFRSAAKTNENYDEKQLQQELQLFNSKFEYYNRDNNTIIDMISLINLTYDTNKENDYDSQRTVRLVIDMGNFFLVVPDVKSDIGKNQILKVSGKNDDNGECMTSYDLINKSLKDLKLKNDLDDSLSQSKLKGNKTVYKYLFKCKTNEIKYHEINGRISNMEFELVDNSSEYN